MIEWSVAEITKTLNVDVTIEVCATHRLLLLLLLLLLMLLLLIINVVVDN